MKCIEAMDEHCKEYHVVIQEHPNNLSQSLYQLQQRGILCDTGIVCKDGVVPIHRLILMAGKCTSLDRLLTSMKNNQNQLQLNDFSRDSVCDLVKGLYTGQFTLHHKRAGELLALCTFLGINAILCALVTVMNSNPCLKQNLHLMSTLEKEENALGKNSKGNTSEERINETLEMEIAEERVVYPDESDKKETKSFLELDLEIQQNLNSNSNLEPIISVSENVSEAINKDSFEQSMFLTANETSKSKPSSMSLPHITFDVLDGTSNNGIKVHVPGDISCGVNIFDNEKETELSKDEGSTPLEDFHQSHDDKTVRNSGKSDDIVGTTSCIRKSETPVNPNDREHSMQISEETQGVLKHSDCNLVTDNKTTSETSLLNTSSAPSVNQDLKLIQMRRRKQDLTVAVRRSTRRQKNGSVKATSRHTTCNLANSKKKDNDQNNSTAGDLKSGIGPNKTEEISSPEKIIKEELSDHQREDKLGKQNSDKPFKCDLCSKSFLSKGSLKQHRDSHSGLKQFQCNICYKGFNRNIHLLNHMETHATDKPHKCYICSRSFGQIENLKLHQKTIHNIIEGKTVDPNKAQFNGCYVCGKTFKKIETLVKHMKTHNESSARPFMCHVCSKTFLAKGDLNRHINTHLSEKEKPYKCDICGKGFSVKVGLQTHTDMAHMGYKPFKCNQCGVAFVKKYRLMVHEKTHLGIRPHKCDLCGKRFTAITSLKTHLKLHAGDKAFACKECEKSFVTNSKLKAHMKTHSGERPYICDVCGKAFCNSGNLKQHMKRHLGERSYKCDLCDKAFYRKSCLKKHILLAHDVVMI